jgi:hypothetical protein
MGRGVGKRLLDNCFRTGAICAIGFCLAQYGSPFASTVTAGKISFQHHAPQRYRNHTIWRESSFAHFNSILVRHLAISQYPNMLHGYVKGVTRCALTSASVSNPLTKSLKAVIRRLVGLCLPSLNRRNESCNSSVPPSTSANFTSDISSGIFHGGWCKVFLIYSYASFRNVTKSPLSAITSPLKVFLSIISQKEAQSCQVIR